MACSPDTCALVCGPCLPAFLAVLATTLLPACRQVEDKLLALLNMRGRHRHKWDFLRQVLAERVVYDDNNFRVWYAPGSNGCGLLYATKQAQIQNMDKPAGVAQRVARPDGSAVVQVCSKTQVMRC